MRSQGSLSFHKPSSEGLPVGTEFHEGGVILAGKALIKDLQNPAFITSEKVSGLTRVQELIGWDVALLGGDEETFKISGERRVARIPGGSNRLGSDSQHVHPQVQCWAASNIRQSDTAVDPHDDRRPDLRPAGTSWTKLLKTGSMAT